MRHILIFIAMIFVTPTAFGQTLKRQENETAEIFANRLKPDTTELAHSVIETRSLDTEKKIIIAFYNKTIYEVRQMDTYVDHSQYNILIGYVFIPLGDNNYERKLIDTIPPDGGDPEILAIFFANADKEKDRELVILCKYEQRHYDYGGAFYEAFIYDYSKGEFHILQMLSKKFWGCECGWRNGKTKKAKYKTAKNVRAGLSKMGYKQ
ncbi:MAG: hypothetical protein WKF91_10235 [Segetibacter sp.]